MANLLLVEPFYTGSHKYWADELVLRSTHTIELLTLPGKFWKWRMHGAAITLADRIDGVYDLIVVTDMLDLALFKSLLPDHLRDVPILLYFHENQLAYPLSTHARDWDRRYAWINYTSALIADHICFNSEYNKNSFLNGLPEFLKVLPDFRNLQQLDTLKKKATVLPLGMDLSWKLERKKSQSHVPVCLWNHRWEHDKNPELFFKTFIRLHKEGVAFKLIILGKSYKDEPEIFAEARSILADSIIHEGFSEDRAEYFQLLHQADILPVTSNHDFFGLAVLEAIYAGCVPLLPYDQAYIEHFVDFDIFYHSEEEYYIRLSKLLTAPISYDNQLRTSIEKYEWKNLILHYDDLFSTLVK